MLLASPSTNPSATLRLMILSVLARGALRVEELPRIVGFAGCGWRPTRDLVYAAVADLQAAGCLVEDRQGLALTAQAEREVARLIDSFGGDVLGEADVIACSTVLSFLPPARRPAVCARLRTHWRAVHDHWRRACEHCPCQSSAVQDLFERRLSQASEELAYLEAVRGEAAA